MYEYRVIKDYTYQGEDLHEGEILTDADFYEPDIPANLIGRGVLEPADMEAEEVRLADPEPEPESIEDDQ